MRFKKHLLTFIIASVAWLTFLIIGLPSDYYLEWSLIAQIQLSVFAFFFVLGVAYIILTRIWKSDLMNASLWCAFYASVPLFLYDYTYAGIIKGHGLSFLISHWYLSIFYLIVWVEFPLTAWVIERRSGVDAKLSSA